MSQPTAATLAAEHCKAKAAKLSDAALAPLLAALPGWTRGGDAISKAFRFTDYFHTMAFVNAVASVAHREDHHPDMTVFYDRCEVRFSTHSAGGLTRNDFVCAARIESLVAA